MFSSDRLPLLIPPPTEMEWYGTGFILTSDTKVLVAAEDEPSRQAAERFIEMLHESCGVMLKIEDANTSFPPGTTIAFHTAPPEHQRGKGFRMDIATEGYLLDISPIGISIVAPDAKGALHGADALWQLLGNPTSLPVRLQGMRVLLSPKPDL